MLQIILAIAFIAILVFTVLPRIENRLLFVPSKGPPEGLMPESCGTCVQDCHIRTSDGVTLHAWHAIHPAADATIIFFHGNAGNISDWDDVIAMIRREITANVLAPDYRGYGSSEGRPTEQGLYADAEAVFDFLVKEKSIPPEKIIVFGSSLGGGAACELALRRKCAGVILEATFTSIPDVTAANFPIPGIRHIVRNRFENVAKVSRISAPILFIHGTDDELIPPGMGRRLYEAASGPKEFLLVEDGHHADCYIVGGKQYWDRWRSFVRKCLDAASRQK
ncbi:MAG TPA: alpha/beta hydrolase [Candidatus Brocadiia bacterium]|nr:alpha/beta hydrolase [Candidatus Brocadiia bacterium]